jgi:hypothetical protein
MEVTKRQSFNFDRKTPFMVTLSSGMSAKPPSREVTNQVWGESVTQLVGHVRHTYKETRGTSKQRQRGSKSAFF